MSLRLSRTLSAALTFVWLPSLAPALDPALNDLSVSVALGGSEVFEEIESATLVRAQRVDSPPPGEAPGDPSRIFELTPPIELSKSEIAALQKVLGEHSTYLAPPKRCRFRANVRYFFGEENPPLAVVLCFGCAELQVWRGKDLLSFSPFDSAYAPLLTQAKRLFPEDEFLNSFDPSLFAERVKSMRDGD